MSDPRRIGEEEARELWRRAAELQAAAEREENRPLPAARDEPDGLSLAEVTAVAEAAGIDPDHVRVALAERRLPDGAGIRRDRWEARLLRHLLGDAADAIEVVTTIAAPPERVLQAVRRVFPRAPFLLLAEMSIGDDPLSDGVLVYRLSTTDGNSFVGAMNFADARVVVVTLRPQEGGTRLRLRVPLFRRGINLALTTGAGAGGGWLGVLAGSSLAGLLGLSAGLVLAPVLGAGALGAAAGVAGYGRAYRMLVGGGGQAVRRLAEAVRLESAAIPIGPG